MSFYKRLGIDLVAGAGQDIRVKVSINDTTAGFLSDKISTSSGKVTATIANVASNETIDLSVNEGNINHNALLNYDVNQHRDLDDGTTTATNLWSANKIQSELDGKINSIPDVVADNRLTKTVSLDGENLEQTGITVDDSDNVTGINNLTVSGNLTVEGTTTTVNSDTLDVVDPNITVNIDGTQASADLASAGLTVEMSDATDAVVGYDSTLTSKFKVGESGDAREVVTTTHTQTIINKTINTDNNTISNIELDNFKATSISEDLEVSATSTEFATAEAVKEYVDSYNPTGDIRETSFSGANNQITFADVTGLSFANAVVRSFEAMITVEIDATVDLYENFTVKGIQKGSDWEISVVSIGDSSLIEFEINTAGQVQYKSGNYAGFTSLVFKFRAITLSV